MDQCSRCRREAPAEESDAFTSWEVESDGETLICPGCLTLGEENAIVDDAVQTEIEARQLEVEDSILDQIEMDEGWSRD
jgi:hypothetical protein